MYPQYPTRQIQSNRTKNPGWMDERRVEGTSYEDVLSFDEDCSVKEEKKDVCMPKNEMSNKRWYTWKKINKAKVENRQKDWRNSIG